jgi:2,3-bisphosphoglycerate-independent phosphoglycerate mutase
MFSQKPLKSTSKRQPLVLVILDGWGIAKEGQWNAITGAKLPTMEGFARRYPHIALHAHGPHVGLPKDQVGNSEAGHLNIGAGRVVTQDAVYISNAIADGTFFKNPAFLSAIQHVLKHKSKLHIMGILSGDQCPHMSPEHVIALHQLAKNYKVRVLWHFFTDGRDSPPRAAFTLWNALKSKIVSKDQQAATIAGRLYLDRKKKWERTEQLYNALMTGSAPHQCDSMEEAIRSAYARGETDEFIEPTVIRNRDVTSADVISDNDSIFSIIKFSVSVHPFFNYFFSGFLKFPI